MSGLDHDGLGVPCPTCGAAPWEWCYVNGREPRRAAGTHLTRLDLWDLARAGRPADAPGGPETAAGPEVAPEPTPSAEGPWRPRSWGHGKAWRQRRTD